MSERTWPAPKKKFLRGRRPRSPSFFSFFFVFFHIAPPFFSIPSAIPLCTLPTRLPPPHDHRSACPVARLSSAAGGPGMFVPSPVLRVWGLLTLPASRSTTPPGMVPLRPPPPRRFGLAREGLNGRWGSGNTPFMDKI